jgi:hypothetical protein
LKAELNPNMNLFLANRLWSLSASVGTFPELSVFLWSGTWAIGVPAQLVLMRGLVGSVDLELLDARDADQSAFEESKVIGGFAEHTATGKPSHHDPIALNREINKVAVADAKYLAIRHRNDHAAEAVNPPGYAPSTCMFRIILGDRWHTPNV